MIYLKWCMQYDIFIIDVLKKVLWICLDQYWCFFYDRVGACSLGLLLKPLSFFIVHYAKLFLKLDLLECAFNFLHVYLPELLCCGIVSFVFSLG